MPGQQEEFAPTMTSDIDHISQFTESYASFNRVINNLQRQYLELKDEFETVNRELAETNKRLVAVSSENLAATKFLNGILNSLATGVIAVDQTGRVTHFNPAASRMLGIPQHEPLGRPYRDMIPRGEPTDASALRSAESGRAVSSVEKTVSLVDGTRLRLSVSTTILYDDKGKPSGAVEVFQDLTRFKKMEQEIARLDTLAQLGEMAATIAHQVRNPLAGIGGFASLLKRDIDPNDPRHHTAGRIIDGVDSLNKTVTALLNYTRSDEVNIEEINYGQYLRQVSSQFLQERSDLSGRMRIIIESAGDNENIEFPAAIDPTLMRQVFFNLFANAYEANGEGTTVSVVCRKMPRQRATQEYADRLLIGLDETVIETAVADNGPGIPEELQAELFSPFVSNRSGGTGLGLAVARKIMKAHSGEIYVENRDMSGARFVLLLPTRIDMRPESKYRK